MDLGTILSIVVGILSFILMMLLGWQAYNIYDLNKMKKQLIKKVDKKMQDYDHYTSALISQIVGMLYMRNIGGPDEKTALYYLLNAINELNQIEDSTKNKSETLEGILSYLTHLIDRDGYSIKITESEKKKL